MYSGARGEWLVRIEKAVIYFFLYSVIGWLYEVFLEVVVYRWGFSNRGVLQGPYCVVYGFGALLLIASLSWLKRRRICIGKRNITPVLVFVGVMGIATLVELIASYIMEYTVGGWQWDYTRFAIQFEGRIALNPSIRFGIGGLLFLYLFQPFFEKMTGVLSRRALAIVSGAIALLLLCDAVYTFFIK